MERIFESACEMLRPSNFLLAAVLLNLAAAVKSEGGFSKADFPPGFVFGAGTTAYQWEGAANEDGRTPSIWDTYAHAGKVNGTGDVASDGYHKYKEDVQLMVETGLDAYRFSISWSRLIPNARGPVNLKGLSYYNNLINELIHNGIEPHVTLNNYDIPQALEDEYGGWLNRKIIKDFTAFADVCFREFGDRVSYWTTLNEPNIAAMTGYDVGSLPPSRCSSPFGFVNCSKGNSSTEPYIAVHHMLLAHASAARLYKNKYQGVKNGSIGINPHILSIVPLTNSSEDVVAAQRARDFLVGWILHPLVFGDYPAIMKANAGLRLPAFSDQESKLVKGSFDFLGVLHYFTAKAKDKSSHLKLENRDFLADMAASVTGFESSADEFPLDPSSLQEALQYLDKVYGNPLVYIYENGQRTRRNSSVEDISRVKYIQAYLGSLLEAVRNGSNVKGYFVWSFLDVFELLNGYKSSFGLYYVDLDDPELNRYPKLSAHWYSCFLKGKSIITDEVTKPCKDLPSLSAS